MSVRSVKNNPIVYGLTGGIASGKSTVVKHLRRKGVLVFDSDESVKNIWKFNNTLIETIKDKYDIDITNDLGKKSLSTLLFNNNKVKKEVESLIHPIVLNEIDEWVKINNNNNKYLVIDMPLLFEIGYEKSVYKTILVYVTEEVQLHRLILRDKITKEEALLKINSQMNLDDKYPLSNYIITNNGNLEDLNKQVDILIGRLEDESK